MRLITMYNISRYGVTYRNINVSNKGTRAQSIIFLYIEATFGNAPGTSFCLITLRKMPLISGKRIVACRLFRILHSWQEMQIQTITQNQQCKL